MRVGQAVHVWYSQAPISSYGPFHGVVIGFTDDTRHDAYVKVEVPPNALLSLPRDNVIRLPLNPRERGQAEARSYYWTEPE